MSKIAPKVLAYSTRRVEFVWISYNIPTGRVEEWDIKRLVLDMFTVTLSINLLTS